jgi:glycosyltransferase 2 family protein
LNQRLWSWPVLSAIVILLAMYFVSDALRLHFILKASGHSLGAGNLGKLTFMNILFSNITPMATGGGFVQIWFLHRRGVSIGTATAATTIRTFIAMCMIFLPIPFLVAGLPYFRGGAMMASVGWILAGVAIGYLVCFLVMLFRLRWLLWVFDLAAKRGLVTRYQQ